MAITKVTVYSANMIALLCIVCGLLTWLISSKALGAILVFATLLCNFLNQACPHTS